MSDSQSNNSESLEGISNHPWIKAIHVNKIRHLENFDISICDDAAPRHLMITGPNGSGKTSLLLAIKDSMEKMTDEKRISPYNYSNRLQIHKKQLEEAKLNGDELAIRKAQLKLDNLEKEYQKWYGTLRNYPQIRVENNKN